MPDDKPLEDMLEGSKPGSIDPHLLDLGHELGEQLMQTQAELQELRKLVYMDQGGISLYNRRKFHEDASSIDGPFALLYCDLDDFKRINDTIGHDFGDVILEGVARILNRSVRQYDPTFDLAHRDGGEEYIALLLNCQETQETAAQDPALQVALRVRENIANADWQAMTDEMLKDPAYDITFREKLLAAQECLAAHADFQVTASIGYAYGTHKEDVLMVKKEAEQHMYVAKNSGKNRIGNIAQYIGQ